MTIKEEILYRSGKTKSVLKENSLSKLKDAKLVDEIVDFIKENPFPEDHSQFHKHFEKLGYESDEAEECAYAMLSVILTGGKSKGKKVEASSENINIGKKIELEHVDSEIDNPVVNRIKEVFIEKIYSDHLTETSTYYVDGVNFKDELKKEAKD